MGQGTTAAKTVTARQREVQALALRRDGLSFAEIAEEVGYRDQSAAYKAVTRALGRLAKTATATADEVRALELERLDVATRNVMGRLDGDDPDPAILSLIRIMTRRAKLLGLDAPTKIAETDPTGEYERNSDAITELQRRFDAILAAEGAGGVSSEPDGA